MSRTNEIDASAAEAGGVVLDSLLGQLELARPHPSPTSADRRRPSSLAYMTPERSGRPSSEVDGRAPFAANDPLECVHADRAVRPIVLAQQRRMLVALRRMLLELLEKKPEDRYQTASGLAYDFPECLAQLTTPGAEPSFPLGCRDVAFPPGARLPAVEARNRVFA